MPDANFKNRTNDQCGSLYKGRDVVDVARSAQRYMSDAPRTECAQRMAPIC